MPVLDWTRTYLEYLLPDGSKALWFSQIEFAVFDIHILQRPSAEADYTAEEVEQAKQCFIIMSEEGKMRLTRNIIAGLPGAEEGYTLEKFRTHLATYQEIDKAKLRENFACFLKAIIPVAEEVGVRADNDLVAMIKQFASRIYFTHLRSTLREDNPKTFH